MTKELIFHVDGMQAHIFKWRGVLPTHIKNLALRNYKKDIGYTGVALIYTEPKKGITEWEAIEN